MDGAPRAIPEPAGVRAHPTLSGRYIRVERIRSPVERLLRCQRGTDPTCLRRLHNDVQRRHGLVGQACGASKAQSGRKHWRGSIRPRVSRGILLGGLLPCASAAQVLRFPTLQAADLSRSTRRFGVLLRDPFFVALVIGIFSGTFAGLMVIGNLKPLGLWAGRVRREDEARSEGVA
jgi:hypothetical protein